MMTGSDEEFDSEEDEVRSVDSEPNTDGICCGNKMDCEPPVTVVVEPPPAHCWLCTFCKSRLAVDLTAFIIENIQNMAMPHITEQLKQRILHDFPTARGARQRDIERHIAHHIVSPEVKMAGVIRSLAAVGETVRLSMTKQDPETGDVLLDNKQVELYLKVMSQMQAVYRTDGKKMLFHA